MFAIGIIAITITTIWATVGEAQIGEIINLKLQNSEVMHLYFDKTPSSANSPNQECTNLYYYDSMATERNYSFTVSMKNICEGD